MAIRKKPSGPKLPQSLQEQIEQANDASRPRNSRLPSRKEARKLERIAQKQRKAAHFSQASNGRKRPADGEHVQSPQRKRTRLDDSTSGSRSRQASATTPIQNYDKVPVPSPSGSRSSAKRSEPLKKKATNTERAEKAPSIPVAQSAVEEEEDAYIAYLEGKLGMGKGKKKAKAFEEDGLDDLMDWADSLLPTTTTKKPSAYSQNEESESEGDEDSKASSDDESEGDSSEDFASEEEEEEWHGISEDDPESDISEDAQQTSLAPPEPPEKKPAAAGAYVPPHLRKAEAEDNSNSETIQKLTKQLKGLLNRMSEQNIATIIDGVEGVYREHRRHDVTSTLTKLIIEGISSHSSLLDSYVVLYAAFVASLHKITGVEFAAYFVQSSVASYERYFNELNTSASASGEAGENDGKECSNLLVLISELYNFQVVSSLLIFDIIRALLAEDLTEFKVELLLKLVRNSGQQLRQDDPSALRDIIDIVQSKVSSQNDAVSSRTRFMIETLTNLKNNKLKRNATQNQGGAAVERMKKFLSGLSKTKHILGHEPLRVSLEDLHSAKTKGKWWLVGAAWGGDPLVDKREEFAKAAFEEKAQEESDLVKLARSQGMNTDIRRGIFVVLMSSDDYLDACERLGQLNLTEIQQREIVRVALQCCGNEKAYNPYYSLVCQQLCRTSHSYKITLQFSLWDFMRELGETSVGGAAVTKNIEEVDIEGKSVSETRLRNIAKAYAWWVAKDAVTIQILKAVDFTMLKPRTKEFLKELFVQIFINSQRTTPLPISDMSKLTFTRNRNAVEEIFIKGSRVQALAMGLVYFLTETFKDKSETELAKFLRWAIGVAKDTLRTGVDLIPTL
ncbi:hypothetical protein CVT26_008765 [Gymnopilus dilepis]|uniref:MI domain-containing protein n=1 Tax=Gymnopilus dilepis TaxID=231916 RepID=A0A409WZP3_9AGAR|nr:hypothetical protein CVT26_008765 [Gymnopilus dilepis]